MRRTVTWIAVVVSVWGLVSQAAFAQVKGKIAEVTVYRGQAMVTRDVPFDAKAGPQEVVVSDLPELIASESLYATGTPTLSIRAVRYRTTAVKSEPRPEVRALDEQIKKKQQDLRRVESDEAGLQKRGQYLDSLEKFTATKVTDDMQKGTLNPAAVQSTAKFLFQQRDEISAKQLLLDTEKDTIQEAMQVLQRDRATLTGTDANKTVREAVVFLEAAQAGAAHFTLSYLVNGVGWSPAYSARLNGPRDKIAVEYQAVVTQMSGEDWSDVKLTLSTSYPKMLASPPPLSPLRISLSSSGEGEAKSDEAVSNAQAFNDRRRDLAEQIRGQGSNRSAGAPGPEGPMGNVGPPRPMRPAIALPAQPGTSQAQDEEYVQANLLAAKLQNIELAAPDEVVRLSRSGGANVAEGLAVEYAIPGTVSLQSRRDQQMFPIATVNLDAKSYYTAAPLLSDYVYQAAEAVNNSEYPLLPGAYNAYLENAFAGGGNLGLVARGQSLTVGFGTETRLRASRELEEKTTDVRGGNKVLKYTYRLRLSNFTDKPVKVRVWDRLPQSPDEQVAVTMGKTDQPLSEDPLYTSVEKPRGLLRWDVEVPAGASGAKAFTFSYQFTLEFDKNRDIGALPARAAEDVRMELDALKASSAAMGFGANSPAAAPK